MAEFKVIIVGGGLAGALLANGLHNNGVHFKLYERDVVDSKREGYQIRLGPGSQAGFRACLTNDHIDKITAKLGKSSGAQATAPSVYNTKFQEIVDLALMANYTKSAAINRVVLRDLLLEPIKKSGGIQYGKGFDRYEIITDKGGKETIRVYFSDGTHDVCDVLVGADGARSKVNKQVGLNNIQLMDSHWSFLSKGSLPVDRMMKLPAKLRQGPMLVFSKTSTFYYALYLPEAETANDRHQIANEKAPLEYDESEASYYWGLNVSVDVLPNTNISEIKDYKKACHDAIKDWASEFHNMIDITEGDSGNAGMIATQVHASKQPSADWRKRAQKTGSDKGHPRVWVMGDAMHAMQPNRGQGGNQALADCADMLPQLLHLNSLASVSPAHPTHGEIEIACEKYEKAMIPRAFAWVQKSGGTNFPRISLDGILGIMVHFAAKLVIPLLKLYLTIFPQKSDE